jgi:hypothetical protein
MRLPLRRLLLLPAALLVLLGAPGLAAQQAGAPSATTEEVSIPSADGAVGNGWASPPTPVDATIVGVSWEGDPDAEFSVEVRGEQGWTTPTPVEGGDEADVGTPDGERAATFTDNTSEPVWIGPDASEVRVSLTDGSATNVDLVAVDTAPGSAPADAAGAIGDAIGLDRSGSDRYVFAGATFAGAAILTALALGWSPARGRRRALMASGLGVIALLTAACVPPRLPASIPTPQPYIHGRGEWAARAPVCGPDYATRIGFAVVHHTVNSNSYSQGQVPQLVNGIQAYHMNANGYCDIAYHFMIDRFGGIWEARGGGLDQPVIGAHAGGFNYGSTSAALIGDFTSTVPTQAAWYALVHLLRWRLSVGGVDPSQGFSHVVADSPCGCQNWPPGTPVFFSNAIVWHRDLDQTACPGNAWVSWLPYLREQVQDGISVQQSTESAPAEQEAADTTTSTSTTSTSEPPTSEPPTTTSSTQPAP